MRRNAARLLARAIILTCLAMPAMSWGETAIEETPSEQEPTATTEDEERPTAGQEQEAPQEDGGGKGRAAELEGDVGFYESIFAR